MLHVNRPAGVAFIYRKGPAAEFHEQIAACYSSPVSYGAAKIHCNSCLVVNKHFAFKKPGVADVFIKGYMHPDRIARVDNSFELCPLDPGEHRCFPPFFLNLSGFLQHPGHEQGSSLKNSLAEQNAWHYRITGIMA